MGRTIWREEVSALPAEAAGDGALVLGRYRPLRPLGSGGSGSVWLVCDERTGDEVALKIVAREGKAGTRAEREAQAAARLRHPRCPRALALHRDDGHVYAAYEYVPGKTLREALRAGDVDDRAAVEAAAQVLEALAHAHRKGIVHRDVKPANVMVEPGRRAVSVRLLDFGLAHIGDADTLTAVGDVPGTLAYIAPERLEGERATAAADVWSVGVVLWEALAGRHPFAAASPVETARRIAEGADRLARSRPDLPRELCALVDRMLALDPRHRPAAARLPELLRTAGEARRGSTPAEETRERTLRERALPPLLAGAYAGGSAWMLPFFPRGWFVLLALAAALAALRSPRAGAAAALAVPLLPLGNLSLGLTLAYAAAALLWLALTARDAQNALLFAAGPLLAPVGALALLPALVAGARGTVRRAAHAAAGVLASAPLLVAGDIDVAGVESAAEAARRVLGFLAAHPVAPLEALVFAGAAAAVPLALRNGAWGVSAWGAAFLAAAVLLPPLWELEVAVFPLVLGVWAATGVLALEALRQRR